MKMDPKFDLSRSLQFFEMLHERGHKPQLQDSHGRLQNNPEFNDTEGLYLVLQLLDTDVIFEYNDGTLITIKTAEA